MLPEIMEAGDLLDDARVDGQRVARWLGQKGLEQVEVQRVQGPDGHTDFVKAYLISEKPGPVLGIVGRLGGVGARPERIGMVSDADGCIVALACAARLARMQRLGDGLPQGGVIVATHVCPNAPTQPHEPTPFMGSPVDMEQMNRMEVDPQMDGILSVDATKGNWVINQRGFAITPTVKEGWVLRVNERLLELMRFVSGRLPAVLPISASDITPYSNGVHHVNSIMQPSVATSAPVVGVATTSMVPVAGCATGANQLVDLEEAGRFCLEVAKEYTSGRLSLHDPKEFERLTNLYGSLRHLQGPGNED